MLEVDRLGAAFGGLEVFRDVSFRVAGTGIAALIGPNGAGKSTLVNLVTGAGSPSSGQARWRGLELTSASPDQVTRRGVIRTFQQSRLFPRLTVMENVLVGAHRLGRGGLLSAVLRSPRLREDERRLREAASAALDAVHCGSLAERRASELTAGQQRLVSVARALAAGPELLILDEPAAGLSDTETTTLGEDLRTVAANGVTMLVIEHHMRFVMSLAAQVIVLAEGRVLADGTPEEVRRSPAVISAYLGGEDA